MVSHQEYEESNVEFTEKLYRRFNIYSGDLVQLDLCKSLKSDLYNICVLNNKLVNRKPTVVTAYYEIKNKYNTEEEYRRWIKDFLKMPFNLVLFTDSKNERWITKERGSLPMVLIKKELSELSIYKKYLTELSGIWPAKSELVLTAIKSNPYKSLFFMWMDFELFKNNGYIESGFPKDKYMIWDKMVFLQLDNFHTKDLISRGESDKTITGRYKIGSIFAWKKYHILYRTILNQIIALDKKIPNEQTVIESVYLQNNNFVSMLHPDIRYAGSILWYPLLYYAGDVVKLTNSIQAYFKLISCQ
jgi:hypothetical protein